MCGHTMSGLLLVGHQFDWLPLPAQNSWETWSMFFQLVKFLVMLWKQKAAQCCSHSSTEHSQVSVRSTIHRNGRFHSGHASVWGISYWLLLVTMQVRQTCKIKFELAQTIKWPYDFTGNLIKTLYKCRGFINEILGLERKIKDKNDNNLIVNLKLFYKYKQHLL